MRRFDLGAGWRKKQYNKKVTRVLYFPYLGGSPRWADSTLNCMVGGLRDVITCAEFQIEIFMVTILQGVEFSIFPLILAWALQQCSATALPVILYLVHCTQYDTIVCF